MRHIHFITAILCVAFMVGCTQSQKTSDTSLSARVAADLRDSDFTEELAQAEVIPYQPDHNYEDPHVAEHFADFEKAYGVPDRTLSEAETKRLGFWVLGKNGEGQTSRVDATSIFHPVMAFYAKHNRIPRDACEIAELDWNRDSLNVYSTLSESDRLPALGKLIYPMTGRIYDSYQSKDWTAWGVDVAAIPKSEWNSVQPDWDKVNYRPGAEPTHCFHLKMYGETPGSTLLDYTAFFAAGGTADGINPCNPCESINPCSHNPCSGAAASS